MDQSSIPTDEPTRVDKLDRKEYASTLARFAETCGTPMVIGIYGDWGIGKTSLMQLIMDELKPQDYIRTIWFDPWLHQFDEHPALGLVHTIAKTLGIQQELRETLITIAEALGSVDLNIVGTGVDLGRIFGTVRRRQGKLFQLQEYRVSLHGYFESIIRKARSNKNGDPAYRLVIFIDDLDRCLSKNIISVFESLKLYLNFEGCVFFVGVARDVLESSIRQHYADVEIDEDGYLDKMIQLPFTIPPIAAESMSAFIEGILPDDLKKCQAILTKGLENNPRKVKRFIQALSLNHRLATDILEKKNHPPDEWHYKPEILAALLLIQYRNEAVYRQITLAQESIAGLFGDTDDARQQREELIAGDEHLEDALSLVTVDSSDAKSMREYIHLTGAIGIRRDTASKAVPPADDDEMEQLPYYTDHSQDETLRDPKGFYTADGIAALFRYTAQLQQDEHIKRKLLIFRVRRQRTWLVTTNLQIMCLLDDNNTRAANRVIQWRLPLGMAEPVRVYRSAKGNYVIDIGPRKRWLVSSRLHPNEDRLTQQVKDMINDAAE